MEEEEYDDPQYWRGLAVEFALRAERMPDFAGDRMRQLVAEYCEIAEAMARRQKKARSR